ncbi:P-loop containing nucleoside triphosphate hydrolase protein [Suillus spraguei]|nr:P-loop containing nucleoside triphosphate hydrolase protein [Suillus spraguei]
MQPDRLPVGHYVHISTPYGQYSTAIVKPAIADRSVSWHDTLIIHEHPDTFSKWLVSIFKSKVVHVEIRALYEPGQMHEVVCAFDMTFKQLLAERQLTLNSDVKNQGVSLKLQVGDTDEQTHPREKNVVIFGETGSGKSSVINVIAQEEIARTTNDAVGCTSESKRYSVDIYGQKFTLFDTAGLNEGTAGTVPHKQAKRQLKTLLDQLHESPSDGIDLLVYCVRKPTSNRAILNAYNTVYSWTCRKKRVPIVVVVTGLEFESPMKSWWDDNEEIFDDMHLAGHACVTTIQEYPGILEDFARRVAESSKILRDLIMNQCPTSAVDDSHGNGVLAGQRAE